MGRGLGAELREVEGGWMGPMESWSSGCRGVGGPVDQLPREPGRRGLGHAIGGGDGAAR